MSEPLSCEELGPDGHGYPRPLMRRKHWYSLNGVWDFAIDRDGSTREPDRVAWTSKILVPFAPETERSGIGECGYFRVCWYRRTLEAPPLRNGERVHLHFGAVDYSTIVWVNGRKAGRHQGGYTPFTFDITDLLTDGPNTVIVRAEDDPIDLEKPRGKQDWQLEPHSIWYPRTTGIWQSVWMEVVPSTWIAHIAWTPSLVRWECGFEAWLGGVHRDDLRMRLSLTVKGRPIANDCYDILSDEVHRRLALSDPGIDDFRNELLWSPRSPTLLEADILLETRSGQLIDSMRSYTALRSICLENDLFVLNGRPYYLRMVLDQGYWAETGMTPPDDEALRKDVECTRAMGFNGVRKHQKIEDPRYLYWADRLGLLVWGEMPSAYRFTRNAVSRLTREWEEALRRDYSHPCIVVWVPINESWGVPNLPQNEAEQHYVEGLYHMTKTYDPTRPVVGNDGWESVATDIIGVHDYDGEPERLRHRYHGDKLLPHLLKQERPGGRLLVVGDRPHHEHPLVLSEFGGIKLSADAEAWGYSTARTPQELADLYEKLMEVVRSLGMFTGFCYTQFADTFQEANGLLYADRRPKFDLARIRAATMGPPSQRQVWMADIVSPTSPPKKNPLG
ncbi:MAG TPA: glycoside hydrolase family 2 TIM barrel-domain containing protein [Candidatus Limnocylindrales bacterium]|nr:glycoside hydrolase family 2 TIM barrel-domain containing protein [Candidatus Limnocylindrales bacterium]